MTVAMIASALSGVLWGWLAFTLHAAADLSTALLAGMAAGSIVGAASVRFRRARFMTLLGVALLGLYVAVALFGFFSAIIEAADASGALMTAFLFPLAMTLSGLVLALWPLSFANYAFVFWLHRLADARP